MFVENDSNFQLFNTFAFLLGLFFKNNLEDSALSEWL
jgi:hypothetical protein